MDDAVVARWRALHGQLQRVERGPGVAASDAHQVGQSLVVELGVARAVTAPVLSVGQGAAQYRHHLVVGERLELEYTGAGDQGRDDLEVGILGRRADEHDDAILDVGQQCVLLCPVPTVDLVHEQDRAPAVHPASLPGLLDDTPQVSHARQHGADGLEVAGGRISDDHRQRRFAGAWRPPEDEGGEQPISLNGAAQQPPLADDVFLADELVQGARAHARRQRRFATNLLLPAVLKQIHQGAKKV